MLPGACYICGMSQEPLKIVWDGQPVPQQPGAQEHGLSIGRLASEQDALDRPGGLASPNAMPRAKRRLELRCDQHEEQPWPLLAVLGPEHLIYDLEALPYPAADHQEVEINCMGCRTRWQLTFGAIRARADARNRLEVVAMSSIAQILPWQG